MVTIDTGSGINITHDKSLLIDYKAFKSPLTTYYGVGSEEHQIPIKLIGQGYFPLKYSATETIGMPTLYCPDEDTTILSAMQLNRRLGVHLDLTYDHLVFPDRKISTIKAQDIVSVPLSEILSEVNGVSTTKPSTTKIRRIKEKYSPKTMSLYEAHVRLNHVNNQAIKDSVNAHVFDDIDHLTAGQNRGEKWCEICRGGKATRSFHYTNSMNAYTEIIQPGTSWSLDIFGPVNDLPSDADRYMLVMVDSVSRYLMVSTHKSKDEKTIVTQIQRNISYVERQFGRTVRVVVADQGTEFNNSLLKNYCMDNGIKTIFTSAHDHSANAKAERSINTIIADTRTLLLQSHLGLKYWSYAALAAADTRNNIYNKNAGDAPLRIISKFPVKILLKNFIPFGIEAMVWQQTDNKLEPRAIRGTLLGRDPSSYGQFVKLHKKNKVISTRNFKVPNLLLDKEDNQKLGIRREDFDPEAIEANLLVEKEGSYTDESLPDSDIPTSEQITDDTGHYVAHERSTTPKVVELSETGSFGTTSSTDHELSERMHSDSGNSDSLPPLPPVSEPITFEKRRVKNGRKPEKVNDDRPVVLPTLDPNDIKAADVSESLKQSKSQKHSLKRRRSQEDMVDEGDNELYDVPSELREDIVGKDNKLLLHPNEAITRRTRSKKKTKLRYIHPAKPVKPLYLSPNELEKHSKIHTIYYKDAISNNKNPTEKALFKAAYDKEIGKLKEMQVFDPAVKLQRDTVPRNKIIPINSIFTIKRSGQHKARIVARGDKQDESTYGVTSTSTISIDSLKLLLIHANNHGWYLKSVDINSAFLHAELKDEIYITHPSDHRYVTPLKKSLYGLKQSPKLWNDTFRRAMNEFGFRDAEYTPGLYVASDGRSMVGTYVDDCLIAAESTSLLDEITHMISSKFSIKTVAVMQDDIFDADILGIDLRYDRKRGTVSLSLETYIETMVKTFYGDIVNTKKVTEVPHVSTYDLNPLTEPLDLSENELKKGIKGLQEKLGRLNYIRTHGRPDIEFAVGKIARYVLYPHKQVINAVNKIIRYLYWTKDRPLIFRREKKPRGITVFTDSSHATEYDLLSRHGYLVFYGRNLIGYGSRKSTIACASSSTAELDALKVGEEVGALFGQQVKEITGSDISLCFYIDSQPVLDWLQQDYWKGKKYFGLRVEYLKQEMRHLNLNIQKINGKFNPADILTKPVPESLFRKLLVLMFEGYVSTEKLTEETTQI